MSCFKIGTIIQNGIFYTLKELSLTNLKDDNYYTIELSIENKISFIRNDLFLKCLPNDIIQYSHYKNNYIIEKIINRTPIVSIGFIKNNFLRLPILSNIFFQEFNYPRSYNKLCLCLLRIELNTFTILKEYDEFDLLNASIDLHKYKDELSYITLKNLLKTFLSKNENPNQILNNNLIRKDLKHLNTITIDPKNSKDADDAISVDIENNKIYIHITDICSMLENLDNKEDEILNAFFFGMTLYTPIGNFNIYSDNLAENNFSLLENEDRYAITTEITLDNNGDILEHLIYPSIINVKKKYDYETAISLFESSDIFQYLFKLLTNNNFIYSKINIPNRKIFIDNNKISDILITHSHYIHKIIELLMIKNNVLIAENLVKTKEIPERFHPKSDYNVELNVNSENLINNLKLLKKLKIASYNLEKRGHFGLNINDYIHFTSPIRRSFDTIIHFLLKGYTFKKEDIEYIINHLNIRERLNDNITKLYEKFYILKYLLDSNKYFNAIILKKTKYGLKVLFEDILYEEFIFISDNDFELLENRREPQKTLSIIENQNIKIKVLEIDLFKLKIDKFDIII